jgi:hypothetical protein
MRNWRQAGAIWSLCKNCFTKFMLLETLDAGHPEISLDILQCSTIARSQNYSRRLMNK